MINNRWCTICCRKSMIMYVKRYAHSNKKKDTCSSCHTHTHPQLSCINRLCTQVVSHTEFSWRKVAVIGQLQLFSAPRFSITCKPLSSSSPSELSQLRICIVHIQFNCIFMPTLRLHLHLRTSIHLGSCPLLSKLWVCFGWLLQLNCCSECGFPFPGLQFLVWTFKSGVLGDECTFLSEELFCLCVLMTAVIRIEFWGFWNEDGCFFSLNGPSSCNGNFPPNSGW
jgi:hypothetical protein